MEGVRDVVQEERRKEHQKLMLVWEGHSVLLLIKQYKKVSTSKHRGAVLSYMKVHCTMA